MNKWVLLVKRNWLAAIIASIICAICVLLLYYNHPASPYFKHDIYVLHYENIGTLFPGNRVQVNGLTRGQVQDVTLSENGVFVTIKVTKGTKIQNNSSFCIINSGLMGEREVAILLGDSKDFLQNGDTVQGAYDEGTSGISRKLSNALLNIDTIATNTKVAIDSIASSENKKRIERINKKVNHLTNNTKELLDSNIEQVTLQVQNIQDAIQKAKQVLQKTKENGENTITRADSLLLKAQQLLTRANTLKNSVNAIEESATQAKHDYKDIEIAINQLSKDASAFSIDLKKNGLKLNVDIF